MYIYYKYGRFITGNLYMTRKSYSETDDLSKILSLGLITKEEYEHYLTHLNNAIESHGVYPVIYVTTRCRDDNTIEHIVISKRGNVVYVPVYYLFSHVPSYLYDGTSYDSAIVRNIFDENYDYGFLQHGKFSSGEFIMEYTPFELKLALPLFEGTPKFIFDIENETLKQVGTIPSTVGTNIIRKLNSIIYAIMNKTKYIMVDVGGNYELVKV